MMSTQENKKAKRRKNKVAAGKCTATIPLASEVAEVMNEENGDAERIARLMDATDEGDIMPPFSKGPNPFMDKEKCLLCGRDKPEPGPADADGSASEDSNKAEYLDGHSFEHFQVWVCQSCRNSTDGLHRSFGEYEISLDPASLGMLGDLNMFANTGETTVNGSVCNCDSCVERKQITQEHEQETKALQSMWTSLRTTVRRLYSMEVTCLNEEEAQTFRSQVDKLCSRDPHQLFLRLESLVREFVIEKKLNLRTKITTGYSTPPQAKEIMSMLLEEYNNLSNVARTVSENLSTLKDHLRRFNVTWELHNKHLYHTIVYTEPAVQGCLEPICEQLRLGALDKESYTEDTYPNLMKNFMSFRNEMSVILVLWHDCQQLIDGFNEEQAALKVKQKWLKEDWEFFKAQRKFLAKHLKTDPKDMPHSMEAQFTETMKNMLTGQKPPAEESHCPRCSRKRCPCDECTITHMITCGILPPEQLETNGTHRTFNFPPDSNRYIIDVSPPSMSSTSSSSASSSPVPITREIASNHLNSCTQSAQGEPQGTEGKSSRVDEGDDKEDEADNEDNHDNEEDDNEEDDDDDEEEEEEEDECEDDEEEDGDGDEDDDDDDDDDDDEEEEDDEDDDGISEDQKEFDAMLASGKLGMPSAPVVVPAEMKLWNSVCQQQQQPSQQTEEALELSSQDYPTMGPPCACHHCVSPAQAQPTVEAGPEECQCHICVQQRGQAVSTALPTSLPLPVRPAGLHLYPHIHGTLPAAAAHSHLHLAHGHASTHHASMVNHTAHAGQDRAMLQPQLYNMHSARSYKVPVELVEDPESIGDHLLSAYGDWDNSSYDTSRILGPSPHRFSSSLSQDLLPPPPMTADSPFSLETLSPSMANVSHTVAASHIMLGASSMATTTSSAFKAVATAGFATGIPPAFQIPAEVFVQDTAPSSSIPSSQPLHSSSVAELNLRSAALSSMPINFSSASPASVSSLPLSLNPPTSTRPVTLGGNVGTSMAPGKEQRTYAQPCKKYTLSPQNSGLGSGKAGVSPPPPPPSSHSHPNVSIPNSGQAPSGKPAPKSRQQASNQPVHSCHGHSHGVHNGGDNHGGEGHSHHHAAGAAGSCSSASALPTTINNVSVGTSTLCTDPECQSHHDDNCDSIDDSCSEKSSSTSTSNNQKEGKYCDCCYCEFFGHGSPPVAQTSKNYAETRERLLRRLKQRNEARQGGPNHHHHHGGKSGLQDHHAMDLDELLKFINGTDMEGNRTGSQQSSRAAKRARQKQRKAEERLRQEEEESKRKAAQQRLLEEEKMKSAAGQKKKSKHKEESQQQKLTTAARREGQNAEDASKRNHTKTSSRAKLRLKDSQAENQSDKKSGKSQEVPLSNGKQMAPKEEVRRPLMHNSTLRSAMMTSALSSEAAKSAGMFNPPAHLMKSLAEHTFQNTPSNKACPPSLTSAAMPTLGGQPNSPKAKKAKRRLVPGATVTQPGQLTVQQKPLMQSLDAQQQQHQPERKIQAQMSVEKQIQEMEELAQLKRQQQQQLQRNNMHSVQASQQQQPLQQLEQGILQQQQRTAEQRKKIEQQLHHSAQKAPAQPQQPPQQPLRIQEHRHQLHAQPDSRQAGAAKASSSSAQASKAASNGVVTGPGAAASSHGKMANGIGIASRPPPHSGASSAAPSVSAQASGKVVTCSTNGLTSQAQKALSADSQARMASQPKAPEHQEQPEQAKNTKSKSKKKKKASQDIRAVDEVFMPRPKEELESNDMDEADRDIEMFKRFVMEAPTPPKERQKLDINLNMKDIFSKKKGGMGCI